MEKEFVYIASPYTIGDKDENVKLQIDAWHIIRDAGYYPIAPLLTHFIHLERRRHYEDWMDYDFALLDLCKKVVRIRPSYDGKERPSGGADREQEEAISLNKEYIEFKSIEELKEYFKPLEKHSKKDGA